MPTTSFRLSHTQRAVLRSLCALRRADEAEVVSDAIRRARATEALIAPTPRQVRLSDADAKALDGVSKKNGCSMAAVVDRGLAALVRDLTRTNGRKRR